MFERVQTLLCKGHWLWEAGPILWMKRSSAGSSSLLLHKQARQVSPHGEGESESGWASEHSMGFRGHFTFWINKRGVMNLSYSCPWSGGGNNPWYLWLIWYDVSGHLPHTLASVPWSPFAAENYVTYFLHLRKVETASLAIRTDIINQVWEKDYPFETTISYTFLVTNTGECCQIFPRKLTPSLQVD